MVVASDDPTITHDLRLRAAIGLAAYQHPKPAPTRDETFIGRPRQQEIIRRSISAIDG